MTSLSALENTAETIKQQRLLDNFMDDIADLRPYLDDPAVTDIFVVGSGQVIVKRFMKGKTFTDTRLKATKVRGIILSAAALLGKHLDPVNGIPKLEAVIPPPYKARITGILPPWVDVPELTLRKPPREVFSLENYVENKRMTKAQYNLLCTFIKGRKNILVGGGTGSGKTTLTNAVLKKMVEYTPNDRFYIVEDVPELQCGAKDRTMISVNPNHSAIAVQTALRWTPDRIIFGELRYGEVANELLKAWNTGHTGGITTIHANDCGHMLGRVESLLREVIVGHISDLSEVIHLLIHLSVGPTGPVVDEITETHTDTKRLR